MTFAKYFFILIKFKVTLIWEVRIMNTYIELLKFISSFFKGSGIFFQFGDNQIRRYETGQ
jgi:hypothetical protein